MTKMDRMADGWLEGEAVYLTDMDRCLPGEAVSPEPKRGRWRTVGYESDELSGTMLVAWQETAAPDVVYPMEVSGLHAITIGAWKLKEWYKGGAGGVQVKARLTGDDSFSVLTMPTISEPEDPSAGGTTGPAASGWERSSGRLQT